MRFYLLLTVCVFTATAAAQSYCDPQWEYEKDGECCLLCDRGKKMLPQSACKAPVCEPCDKNEYMDKNTNSSKCLRQPYCDPNKNFQIAIHDRTKRTTCLCKVGFHCSSVECITCIQHTKCGPGSGVQTKGDQTHDTVCQQCPDGTFSNESSSDTACQKWSECDSRHEEVEKTGTKTSDTTCVKKHRGHIISIVVVAILVAIALSAGFACYICKKKSRYMEMKAKACTGCQETEGITQAEPWAEPGAEPGALQERSTPVENEDEESMVDHGVTENGNVLTQEYGKMEILSRQESQTQESCSM